LTFKNWTQNQIPARLDRFIHKITIVLLYRVFNGTVPGIDWVELNLNIISTRRQATFDIHKSMNFRIGNNIQVNKFSCVSKQIPLDLLNLNFPAFKRKMKDQFLSFER
jgi:hypothetical protein